MPHFDLITVGGGLGGSAIAKAMAEQGAKVLVLEQELRFRDRIRGEFLAPWGVAEVRELGLFETFLSAGACEVPWVELGMGPPRDLAATTSQRLAALTYSHPRVQEALIEAARKAGAEVRRGVSVQAIEPGASPAVECKGNGSVERITGRLIVAADGRNSAARKWAGFKSQPDEHPFLIAGVLLSGVPAREDLMWIVFNPNLGTAAFAMPQGQGRFRSYLTYPTISEYRLQGKEKLPLFLAESVKAAPMLAEAYAKAKDCGPLASFDTSDSWIEHPYKDGIALIGDAAATSDPSFGQGMSLTLRDARVLRDQLSSISDWDRAGHAYARQHDGYFANYRTVSGWFRQIFLEQTPAAVLQRQKALPLMEQDPTRIVDHLYSGPELPLDDAVRSRFFGES